MELIRLTTARQPRPEDICKLLQDYEVVFYEAKGLPPTRTWDHHIPLIPGAQPVDTRPYRYPHHQKDEIEKMVGEMLTAGIIRPNQSPFASPTLIVRKGDGTWQLCVDYRALNKLTMKDKFPIPIIDELLHELHGA